MAWHPLTSNDTLSQRSSATATRQLSLARAQRSASLRPQKNAHCVLARERQARARDKGHQRRVAQRAAGHGAQVQVRPRCVAAAALVPKCAKGIFGSSGGKRRLRALCARCAYRKHRAPSGCLDAASSGLQTAPMATRCCGGRAQRMRRSAGHGSANSLGSDSIAAARAPAAARRVARGAHASAETGAAAPGASCACSDAAGAASAPAFAPEGIGVATGGDASGGAGGGGTVGCGEWRGAGGTDRAASEASSPPLRKSAQGCTPERRQGPVNAPRPHRPRC